ncbi:MAG TPA: hypothetical protein DIW81_30215 [Planctomycetaceae bacterium]|nr:hypothetical protein [Planctomycetaceae bacterium]
MISKCFKPFLMLLIIFSFHSVRADDSVTPVVTEEPAIDESDLEYWAYQAVVRPDVPEIENDRWSTNPIDRFVLTSLQSKDHQPVEFADKETLLRRVTYNLTGLPPQPEEIHKFLADDSKEAWNKVISRLLDSPAYGERWSQHWLDLVRFAETDGFEHDKVRPEAWRYRDWVIEAFNEDLPYDQFLKLQLAGDEIAPDSDNALIATGYLMAGPEMPDINSQDERRHNFLNAMTANVGEVFLGLRFGCAQCHHHRTDPISQHDFYRLRSFFETIDLFKDQPLPEQDDDKLKARVVKNRTKSFPESYLWIRGDYRRPGDVLHPNFPRVLQVSLSRELTDDLKTGRRKALAEWLTDHNQPLTARVFVNRVWQHHFGVGLIPTTSDFGWMGESASHPELLDWLAAEFMEFGWSIKKLHRLILTSSTYRLASHPSDSLTEAQKKNWNALFEEDPENRWLGRMNRQRLEGEAIRDALLSVSGELNRKQGGPGVRPPLPPAVASTLLKNQWPVTEDESEHTRRSIYLFARRNLTMPMLEAFDKPDANLSCPERSQTTIAPQALHLLNSEFARECSLYFAERLKKHSSNQSEQIEQAYLLSMGRFPTVEEQMACDEFLTSNTDSEVALVDLCQALLNLNEFVYLD